MAKTITFDLGDQAVSAYAQLQSAGVDIDEFVGKALIDEAHRVRGRASHAAELLEHERQQVDLEDMRDIPHQIEYMRPPR